MSINRVVEIGRQVKPAELRYTPAGVAVASFTIAVNGIKMDDVSFFDCVAWRQTAEYIANYGDKGRLIGIEGKLQARTYENKEGKKVKVVEIVVDQVQFLDSKKSGDKPVDKPNDASWDDVAKEIKLEDMNLPDDETIPF